MLTNGVILAISSCDTLRPKHLVRPFVNSVRDTKYHKRCSDANSKSMAY